VFALGVDLSPAAVELATGRGARAVVASIFDELPGSGRWRSALLLDGNIGIGGAPARLLARIGVLLREDGELLVELGSPRELTEATLVRIEADHGVSGWFSVGARVGRGPGIASPGRAAFASASARRSTDAWFARLHRA